MVLCPLMWAHSLSNSWVPPMCTMITNFVRAFVSCHIPILLLPSFLCQHYHQPIKSKNKSKKKIHLQQIAWFTSFTMALKSETENSRLQAGPWTCRVSSSVATASEQRGHWLNLDLLSHSPSRCSVRLAISTTCKHNAELYAKSSSAVIEHLDSWGLTMCQHF